MKITFWSDIHGNLFDLPSCDITCCCGDICPATNHSTSFQGKWLHSTFIPWIGAKIKKGIIKNAILVAGNHDYFFEELMEIGKEDIFRNSLPDGVHYLRDSMVEIDGLKFWGSPWSNKFGSWAFMEKEDKLDEIYSKIPNNINYLLTHGPAYGYGDCIEEIRYSRYDGQPITPKKEYLGSKSLIKHIDRAKVDEIYCGHIHSGNHNIVERVVDGHVTKFANVSILDEQYQIHYKELTNII